MNFTAVRRGLNSVHERKKVTGENSVRADYMQFSAGAGIVAASGAKAGRRHSLHKGPAEHHFADTGRSGKSEAPARESGREKEYLPRAEKERRVFSGCFRKVEIEVGSDVRASSNRQRSLTV